MTEMLDLVLERTLNAPRELVWKAWTDPKLLKQWFAPKPYEISEVEINPLAVLERALQDRPYLLGETFTLADLNLAATLSEPHEKGLVGGDLDPAARGYAALADWLRRCQQRRAWKRVCALL